MTKLVRSSASAPSAAGSPAAARSVAAAGSPAPGGARARWHTRAPAGSRARWRTRALATGAALAAVCLSPSGTSAASQLAQAGSLKATAASVEPALPTPLATSVQAGGGTWATLPMGHLGQPLNTFWQLFYRADGSTSWSDKVQATAVATNGGLVLATGGSSLSVGIRPSQHLTFSPIISTVDSGRSWSDGLLNEGLADRPEALATGPGGMALALVEDRSGGKVLKSTQGLSSWQPLVSADGLSSGPAGRACGLRALTAVGYAGRAAVLGASCERPAETGIFVQRGASWQSGGPVLSSRGGAAEVLGLLPLHPGTGLAALLALTPPGGSGARLVVAWTSDGTTWRASQPLPLAPAEDLVSFGADDDNGAFVLSGMPDGQKELAVTDRASSGWHQLSAPPPGTATVAFGPGTNVAALAVSGTVLTVWVLPTGSTKWVEKQVMHVPVQFGSSS
jgi:hypothetical protein